MMRWLDNCNNRINFPLQIQQYRVSHKRQAIEIKPIQYLVAQLIKDLRINN